MTAAWWEDDEIECVWLGEGRIEHKPVLRKITIFSRWVKLFLPNMWNNISRAGDSHKLTFELLKAALPDYAIQWRDGWMKSSADYLNVTSCFLLWCKLLSLHVCQLHERVKIPKIDPTTIFTLCPGISSSLLTDKGKSRRWCSTHEEDQRDLHLETQTVPPSPRPQPHNPLKKIRASSLMQDFPTLELLLPTNELQ